MLYLSNAPLNGLLLQKLGPDHIAVVPFQLHNNVVVVLSLQQTYRMDVSYIRPKKKMFVALFQPTQNFGKVRVPFFFSLSLSLSLWFSCCIFKHKMFWTKCQNVKELSQKKYLTRVLPLPTTGSNQFWASACPRMHTHE